MKVLLTAAALALGITSSASAANLVTNGDFETGDFTGWTQDGDWFIGNPPIDPDATAGALGFPNPLSQNVALVAGGEYELSFTYWATSFLTNFHVSIDTFTQGFGTLPGVPTNFTTTFTATGPGTLSFHDVIATQGTVFIDDVSVSRLDTAVPEPSTWALMILGFGAAGAALRRESKNRLAI